MTAFEEFGVMPEIAKAVQEKNWELPRDIQAEAIPLILGGGDVMAAAETGSGKTGAFALPTLQIVYETLREQLSGRSTTNTKEPAIINTGDRDNSVAISPDGLIAQSRSEQWAGARSNRGIVKGRYYYEVSIRDEGLCRVGWSTRQAKLDLGTDKNGFGYGGTGKKSNNRQFDTYGEPFTKGDVIGCYIDLNKGLIGYSKNGNNLDIAFEIPTTLHNFTFFPAFCVKNAELEFNFGGKPWAFAPQHFGGNFNGVANATEEDVAQIVNSQIKRKPLAIILEPTRELAQQTHDAIVSFMKYLPPPKVETLLIVGGVAITTQVETLENGVDIVTGTPGRIEELVNSGKLDVSNVRFYVLDEADALVETSHPIVMKIYNMIPKSRELQVLMFSATLHSTSIKELGNKICRFPTWVDLKGKDAVPDSVDHAFVLVDPKQDKTYMSSQPRIQTDGVHFRDKVQLGNDDAESLSQAIKMLKPSLLVKIIDAYKMDQAMIFCRTKVDCDNLETYLGDVPTAKKGPMIDTEYSCVVVHSDKSQQERSGNIKKFKDGEVRFLICTDVAARGIDIHELPYMINYTLPDNPEDYIHRTGRVGRAERIGLAISLVGAYPEKVWFHKCQSRGKNCNNTNLVTEQGCAMWYDEPEYWREVQTRLNMTVPSLGPDYKLASTREVTYGQKKEGSEQSQFIEHSAEVKPIVAQLSSLEDSIQKSYWSLKLRFQ